MAAAAGGRYAPVPVDADDPDAVVHAAHAFDDHLRLPYTRPPAELRAAVELLGASRRSSGRPATGRSRPGR